MEKMKINFFKRIIRSTYDFSFYKIVKNETLGKAFGYLVLFSLLLGILGSIGPAISFNSGIDLISDSFKTDIPYFEFSNGELNVEGEMPIVIGDDDKSIVIIDTTNQTDVSVLDDYQTGILVNKDKLIYKDSTIKTETYEFNDMGGLSLTKYDVQNFLPYLKFISIIIFIFIIIWVIIGKLFSTLIISLIGLIVNSGVKSNLQYGDIYKLGIYSITLPSILKLTLNFLNISIPYGGWIFFFAYYGIVTFYLVKAMIAIREDKSNDIDIISE